MIINGHNIHNKWFDEKIFCYDNHDLDSCLDIPSVVVSNCYFKDLEVFSVTLPNIKFDNCIFEEFIWQNFWVKDGMTIENSVFKKDAHFIAGGHNKQPISIKNTSFECHANFCDCWFMDKVYLENVTFHKGTNLLIKNSVCEVQYDKNISLINVYGKLDESEI